MSHVDPEWSRIAFEHAPSSQLVFTREPRPRCVAINTLAREELGLSSDPDLGRDEVDALLDGSLAPELARAISSLGDDLSAARARVPHAHEGAHVIELSWRAPFVHGTVSGQASRRSKISLHDATSDLLHLIIDTLTNPIFVKDRDHRWILGNQAFADLLGQDLDSLLGKTDLDLFPPDQAAVFWEKDDEVFAAGELVGNEEALTDASGQTFWIYTQKTPVTLLDGTEALVGIITDITARKRAEEALLRSVAARDEAVEAHNAKNVFLAKMSHELRTPMNSIIGYAELLLEDATLEPQPTRDVEYIIAAAGHLSSLIRDALDMSVIESGELTVKNTTFGARELIAEALVMCTTERSSNTFACTCSDTLTLHTDRTKLRQIMLNLVSNADKFTESGEVLVSMDLDGERPCLMVRDTGIGISPQAMTTIFDTFTQEYEGDPSFGTGTGLGLAIVQGLVRALDAEITVESVPRQGTTFRVTLPAHALAP